MLVPAKLKDGTTIAVDVLKPDPTDEQVKAIVANHVALAEEAKAAKQAEPVFDAKAEIDALKAKLAKQDAKLASLSKTRTLTK